MLPGPDPETCVCHRANGAIAARRFVVPVASVSRFHPQRWSVDPRIVRLLRTETARLPLRPAACRHRVCRGDCAVTGLVATHRCHSSCPRCRSSGQGFGRRPFCPQYPPRFYVPASCVANRNAKLVGCCCGPHFWHRLLSRFFCVCCAWPVSFSPVPALRCPSR